MRIYGINLDAVEIPKSFKNNVFSFRILGEHDAGIVRQIENMEELLAGQLSSKIASKALCLVALDGDKILSIGRAPSC